MVTLSLDLPALPFHFQQKSTDATKHVQVDGESIEILSIQEKRYMSGIYQNSSCFTSKKIHENYLVTTIR
jgi:hypothetical protein